MSSDAQKTGPSADGDAAGSFNVSCLDLMLIEMVPMAHRIAEQVLAEQAAQLNGNQAPPATSDQPAAPTAKSKSQPSSLAPSSSTRLDVDEVREAALYKLEGIGYRVGLGLVESLSQSSPLAALLASASSTGAADGSGPDPSAYLDTIKFLCKDLWSAVFRKQIDNLKTNHRGTFVLTDNRFEPLKRASLEVGRTEEAKNRATPFLWFPQGLVRGALSGLGLDAEVKAEVAGTGVPCVVFTIRVGAARAS